MCPPYLPCARLTDSVGPPAGREPRNAGLSAYAERDRDGTRDSFGDFALQDQHVTEVAFGRLGPDLVGASGPSKYLAP